MVQKVYVATDDRRIYDAVSAFGGNAVMTYSDYQSGTDRIADVVKDMECDIVVNLQGDEPVMNPETIDLAVNALLNSPACDISTAMVEIRDENIYFSPNVVKVVCSFDGHALYFSRSPIPSLARAGGKAGYERFFGYKHLGLYVYRRDALLSFPTMQPTFLEKLECLEQLRFLEYHYKIKVVETPHDSIGVDTPDDLKALEVRIKGGCEEDVRGKGRKDALHD
jgi:3-deoxy-manno-octulosonate cytidylyltransferase (CMP-KDO synthetase)